jgi:hypothetical protein
MEVIIFALFAFVLLWKFGSTPMAEDKVELHNPDHADGGCTSVVIAGVTLAMALMGFGALVGGGSADFGAYEVARQSGGDDAVALVALFAAVGGLAVLAMVNGIAFKLSFAIFLLAVVGSVAFIAALGG